jgi:LysM repeat protein
MIALIPQLESSLAYLRPETGTSPSQESSFAEVFQAVSAQAPPQTAATPTYVVQKGDNLSEIAKKLGYSNPMELARANGLKNANLLQVGQVLKLPTGTNSLQDTPPTALAAKSSQEGKNSAAYVQEKKVNARAGKLVVTSWYGANHAGKSMANGRPFDMYA